MSITELLPKDVEKMIQSSILNNVISRDDFPTEVNVIIFFCDLGYALKVSISHDNFKRDYTYKTHHTNMTELLRDDALNKKIIHDVDQFALDYFQHCMTERHYTTITTYRYDSETGQSYQSDVHKYYAKTKTQR